MVWILSATACQYDTGWCRIVSRRVAPLKPDQWVMSGPDHRADPRATRDNVAMDIHLNGDIVSLPDTRRTITALLLEQGLAGRRVAVEVNGEIVPRSRHDAHALAEGDKVEIVHALGGG